MMKIILKFVWFHGFLRGYLGLWNNHKYLRLDGKISDTYDKGFVRGIIASIIVLPKIFWKPIINKTENDFHFIWLNIYFSC